MMVLNAWNGTNAWHLVGIEPETGRERWTVPAEGQRADFVAVIGDAIPAELHRRWKRRRPMGTSSGSTR